MTVNKILMNRGGLKKLGAFSIVTIKPDFKLVGSSLNLLEAIGKESFSSNEFVFSRLSNGLRVITGENNSRISKLGLFIRMGTRMESDNLFGASKILYDLTLNSRNKSCFGQTLIERLNLNGIVTNGIQTREFTSFFLEYINGLHGNHIDEFLDSVFRVYKFDFKDSEIERSKENVSKDCENKSGNIEVFIQELLHSTAWSKGTLGNLQAHSEDQIKKIKADDLKRFKSKYFSPENMVIFGLGIKHIDLLKKVTKISEKLDNLEIEDKNIDEKISFPPSIYTGGIKTVLLKNEPFTNITVALNASFDWKSRDLIALYILQAHLGGGSSFSIGGPGKGMFSKLYLDVLNKIDWVESCNSFVNQFSDSGIFGIQLVSFPGFSSESIKTIALQFKGMREITEEELNRAKNLVKGALSMIYEDKNAFIENIAIQILSHSEYITIEDIIATIDEIRTEDIRRVSERILCGIDKPTVIAVGPDVNQLPNYDEIKKFLRQACGLN